jgi:hypothetical protein
MDELWKVATPVTSLIGIGKISGVSVREGEIGSGVVAGTFHRVATMGSAQFIRRIGAVKGSFRPMRARFGKEDEGRGVHDHAGFEGCIGIHASIAFVIHSTVEDDALQ